MAQSLLYLDAMQSKAQFGGIRRSIPLLLLSLGLVIPSAAEANGRVRKGRKGASQFTKAVNHVRRQASINSPHRGTKSLAQKADQAAAAHLRRATRQAAKAKRGASKTPTLASKTKLRLIEAGAGPKTAERAIEHVGLGMPSNASRRNHEDFLMVRNQYVLSYSKTNKVPNWVAWKLSSADLGTGARKNDFRPDRTIPRHWGRATDRDYKHSGYTRGHLVASGERQNSTRANSKTFVFTNIVPQLKENNGGPWLHLEEHYREQASHHNQDVYIMSGSIYEGARKTIGANNVAVPSATWKVAVFAKKGQPISEINASNRVISVIIPNREGLVSINQPFTAYRVTPKEVEQRAGVHLFSHLPANVRSALLEKKDTVDVKKMEQKRKERAKKKQRKRDSKRSQAEQTQAN